MFKNYRIKDVFYKINTPKIKAKANDFPTEHSSEFCIPLLTAGAENQGLNRYAKGCDCTMIINNAISVSANGANSGICFYQPHDFAVLQDAYAVKVNDHEIESVEEGLYLTGALNKAIRDNHDWVNKAGWNNIKDDNVELPVVENSDPDHEYTVDDIDWQYMRDRITELERDRITELNAYLQATGLNDYELTDEDKKVLSLFSKRTSNKDEDLEDIGEDEVRFGEFVVKDVLNVDQTKSVVAKSDLVDGTIPYVTRTVSDNGYMGTCGNTDKVNVGNCITIGAETGIAFYQPSDFVAGNKVYRLSREGLGIKEYLYLASVLNMQTKNYSYSNARIPEKIKAEKFLLPVIENSNPDHEYTVDDIDWQYMERYIRAIEKVVIADVVKYKDKVIEATRKVINTQDEDF